MFGKKMSLWKKLSLWLVFIWIIIYVMLGTVLWQKGYGYSILIIIICLCVIIYQGNVISDYKTNKIDDEIDEINKRIMDETNKITDETNKILLMVEIRKQIRELQRLKYEKINTVVVPNKNTEQVDNTKISEHIVEKIDTTKIDPVKIDTIKIDTTKIDPAKIDATKIDPAKIDPAKN